MAYNPNNPNGQAAMSNSAPVVIASDQSGVPAKSDYTTASGSTGALNGDAIAATDVSVYRWVSVALSGTFSATMTFQGSNDNSNWFAITLSRIDASSAMTATSSTTGTVFAGPLNCRYFRVRCTTYTSGTVQADALFSSLPGQVFDVRRLDSVVLGTAATSLGKAEDGPHASGDTGVMALAVRNDTRGSLAGTNLDYAPPQLNSSGDVRSELSSVGGTAVSTNNGASGAGVQRVTIANDSTGVLASVATVTSLTGGGVAHDSADSGNPVKIGGRAETSLATATMVADGDRADAVTDADGALLTRLNFPLSDLKSERVTDTGGIVYGWTSDVDSSAAWVSGVTNSNLTSITERFDAGTISGNGGGLAVYTGIKATAGNIGFATANHTSAASATTALALIPVVSSPTAHELSLLGVGS